MVPLINEPEQIRQIFDTIAPVYDRLNDQMSFGLHRVWKKMTVAWSGCAAGSVALDVCCGTGDLAFLLARRTGPTGKVYGVDFSTRQLALARKRDTQRQIIWQEADALALPFDDRYFDVITQGFGLRNVLDIPSCLKEMHRVLKPGGRVVILDLHRPRDQGWRAFQQWYLNQRVTSLGRAEGLEDEYAYIAPSLERFPTGAAQVQMARQAGFSQVRHTPLVGETVGVLVAQ
ncbi:MAG: bifunctional demethylmenaquinone methyltransferase/2-methoxy-6-polyprenyl-1,4-benzoquinol methylase UbiE [Gemmatimonadaceae bacterium]|nr:bifunctional demethylmenaquinone methyltransferase/2-methoxy-6-polyprenyl-1,4-benzoquinol methylase UbiE [Gloeobacterales cyanobacterium ES-bin-141]